MIPLVIRNKLIAALPIDSLRRRFVKGAFWSTTGMLIGQGLGLVASIVVARILGKTGFGELGMIESTVGMFGVFAGFGLGVTATKHVAEFRVVNPVRAGRIIALSTMSTLIFAGLISLVIFLASPYLANYTINAQHLTRGLQIGCGLIFFNTLIRTQIGVLSGFEAFKAVAKVSLFRGLLNFPLVIIGVYLWGLFGAISGMVCTVVASFLINQFVLRTEAYRANIPVSYRNIRSELPVLWKFSLPAFLSSAMVSPVMWGASALLVNQIGGYAELGIFTAATRFQFILSIVGAKIGTVLLPMLASGDGMQSDRFNRANILMSWLIGMIPGLLIMCFPEILGLLFGIEYSDISARRTLTLVMCYTSVVLYKQGLARVLVAKSLMWWALLNNIIWAMVLLGSFCFLKQFGAIGLAGAVMIAYALNTIVLMPLYSRRRLIPKGTMISFEAATIWIVIAGLALLSIFQFSLLVRGVGLLASVLPLYMAFHRLFYVPEVL